MRIIGCGNPDRGDDGAGVLAAERLRALGIPAEIRCGETLDLIEAWRGAEDVIVIDAVVTGAPVGTIQVWDGDLPGLSTASASTHGFGLAEAVMLARALHCLPPRMRIYGIEGACFDLGAGPSAEVRQAAEEVALRIAMDHFDNRAGSEMIEPQMHTDTRR